jgi:hypothetical protein
VLLVSPLIYTFNYLIRFCYNYFFLPFSGAPGPAGPAGAIGATGPVGPAGADGAPGPAGKSLLIHSILNLIFFYYF